MAHEPVLVVRGMALLAYTNTPSLTVQGLCPHLKLSDIWIRVDMSVNAQDKYS